MNTARDSVSFYLCLSAFDSVHRIQSAQVLSRVGSKLHAAM